MEESLNRIIQALILPKYPWIKEFKVVINKRRSHDYTTREPYDWNDYAVLYFPDYSMDIDSNEFENVSQNTTSLFKMLNTDRENIFGGAVFKTEDGRYMSVS